MFYKINKEEFLEVKKFITQYSKYIYNLKTQDESITSHRYFPFTCYYLAFIEFSKNNPKKSEHYLQLIQDVPIGKYLVKYIKNRPEIRFYAAISTWSETNIAKTEFEHIVNIYGNHLQKISKNNFTLFDIGTGDGLLLSKIINQFECLGINNLEVIALDKDEKLLSITKENVIHKRFNLGSFEVVCQDMSQYDFSRLKEQTNYTIINASSVLHELPKARKADFLNKLYTVADCIFISELESNHDIIQDTSLPLLASTYNFYNGLIYDSLNSDIKQKELDNYIINYLIHEVFEINLKPYNKRINYHMSKEDWLDIFASCNFKTEIYEKVISDYLPKFFVFKLLKD